MLQKVAFAIFLSVAAYSVSEAKAQSPPRDHPDAMLGFLKLGMQVGIDRDMNRDQDTEPFFKITIFSDRGLQIAHDSRQLSLDELREKYPSIDEHAKKTLSSYKEGLKERAKELEATKRYAEPTLSMGVNTRTLFCTIVSVGDDYTVVAFGESRERKRLIPKHMIKQFDWDDGVPNLRAWARVVDVDETEQ